MADGDIQLTRPPDDLPEARVWRPDLGATGTGRHVGHPVQPALFPLPTRASSRAQPFADLLQTASLSARAHQSGPGRTDPVTVTTVGAVPAAGLPDVRRWAVNLGVALVEVVLGHRPLAQLLRWLDDDALRTLGLAVAATRDRAPGPAVRERIRVVSARIQIVHPERVEVCLHATRTRDRLVVAFRLAAENGRWLCTELHLLGPRRRTLSH